MKRIENGWTENEDGELEQIKHTYIIEVNKRFVEEALTPDEALFKFREGIDLGCVDSRVIAIYEDDNTYDDEEEYEDLLEEEGYEE